MIFTRTQPGWLGLALYLLCLPPSTARQRIGRLLYYSAAVALAHAVTLCLLPAAAASSTSSSASWRRTFAFASTATVTTNSSSSSSNGTEDLLSGLVGLYRSPRLDAAEEGDVTWLSPLDAAASALGWPLVPLAPYISPIYLPCISPISPLHLPYISPISPHAPRCAACRRLPLPLTPYPYPCSCP